MAAGRCRGQGRALGGCASSSSSSHCTKSTSSSGQEAAVSTNHNVHAGYVCGSGSDPSSSCESNGNGVGKEEETWYRFHVRLAPGFQATPGTQNSIIEFHVDQRTEADAKAHGGGTAYSTIVDIEARDLLVQVGVELLALLRGCFCRYQAARPVAA